MAADDMMESTARDFQAYGRTRETITPFKYLGRIMTTSDDDWTAVVGDLWKAQNSWTRLSRILGREGASTSMSGMFCKAVVQAVIIFGTEKWVMTPHIGKSLGGS